MERRKTLVLFLILIVILSFNLYALVLTKSPVPSASAVETGPSIGVYWDQGCTQSVGSISWGTLQLGGTQEVDVYVRNEGNDTFNLALTTQDWQPENVSVFLNFSWSCQSQSTIVAPGQIVEVNQTLSVASDFPGDFSNFSFSIVFEGIPSSPGLVVRGEDDDIYYRTYNFTADSWGGWDVLPGATNESPAAAIFQNKLYIVFRGIDGNTLSYGYVDLSTNLFSGWTLLDGATPSAPTLTSNGTVLCLVVRGMNNDISYRCYSGSWGSWVAVPSGATLDSPAAAMLGNNLHIVVRGMDGSSLWDVIMGCDGTVVRNWRQLSGATNSRPTLASSQDLNETYLVVAGLNNRIYYMNYTGTTDSWSGWSAIPTGATDTGPAATVSGSQLYTIVQGMDGSSLWNGDVDLGTNTFSGWASLDGSTPSAPTLTS